MSNTDKVIQLQNFDIEIMPDGRWFHEGGEIKRLNLVKLFASVLSCDEAGRYWLTTPVEKGEITVHDAPFVIQSLRYEGRGRDQVIYLTDNLGETYKLGADYPLSMRMQPKGDDKPYLLLPKGLCALIKHAVFYEMIDLALAQMEGEVPEGSEEAVRLYSDGVAFALQAEAAKT
ncbi:MAG: DUF1285 domain-containing protein [Candidatus Puniceispirillaceae bacterium]